MLYQIKNGAVELGSELILKKLDFEIRDTEKIAIVGRNGCGKTTLLRLIAGEVELSRPDSGLGEVYKSGKLRVGYLKQNPFEDLSLSVDAELKKALSSIIEKGQRLDSIMQRLDSEQDEKTVAEFTRLRDEFERDGGYFYEKEYNMLLTAFGFSLEDKNRTLCEFSGGQLTKLGFIKLLLAKPDVLLLDEPTNHLDIKTLEWLEGYLKEYKKAVVVVSHDRMFLDKIADVVYEIEYGEAHRYVGNYSAFVKAKEQGFELQLKAYKAQRAEIDRLSALIERFRDTPTKVSMTESKLKQIERMVKIDEPRRFDTRSFRASFTPNRDTGKDILSVNGLVIGYDTPLVKPINMKIYKKQRIGVIGANGCGKSTLLKTLVGEISALSGGFSLGHQVDIGYFDQQMAQYVSSKTVLDELWDEFPQLSETEIRSSLGAFMFTGDDAFKTVDKLSGGERVRLALCKILKRKPNFLILDEPTNHMDMIGKETLENMLAEFEGTLLFVSHDRYFVKKLATGLVVFEGEEARELSFTYDEYLSLRERGYFAPIEEIKEKKEPQMTRGRESYNQSKERARAERRLVKISDSLSALDEEISGLRAQSEKEENLSNYVLLCELGEQIEALEEKMLSLMEEQETLEMLLKTE